MNTSTMTKNDPREELISKAYESKEFNDDVKVAVFSSIEDLDAGRLRVCEKLQGEWTTRAWVKKSILLYFQMAEMKVIRAGDLAFYDKVPLKQWSAEDKVRVVPHAIVRKGAFVEPGAILMPSYINIGAYVGSGTMVDTWATVGSCAQLGKSVHLSGGVGIGGVLEPVQASPVIVEDHVFIGSRCIVVEGAVIEESAVLGAGTVITASTRIIDVTGSDEKVYRGRVPKNAVVIPGTSTKKFPAGEYQIPSALLIGYRSEATDKKVSLTDALREHDLSV